MNFSNPLANAVRILSVDTVEQAKSGHPGMPLGMADIATVLWAKFLKHNPANPYWFNRDRFVLSNGHGSMLLYSLLHLSGYKLDIDSIKNFRQLNSKTPGHPECTDTPGVETTTGPLGQGLANAVGMAIAEKILANQFNTPKFNLVDHFTYTFVGDGCLMEGISHEVCSLAGTLGLGKLIVFYDDNGISIDGNVNGWFTDDTNSRFKSCGWHVIDNVDGHNEQDISEAIINAKNVTDKPTLIICKTIIGLGSLVAGQAKSHGAPLGALDIEQLRKKLHWSYPPFEIPEDIYARWNHLKKGNADEQKWLSIAFNYQKQNPTLYFEFLRRINGDLPDKWQKTTNEFINTCALNAKPAATRIASQNSIEFFASILPELFGGSADLTCSNNTNWSGTKAINTKDFSGNYLNYGVREFGMAAIANGLALHGGFIPYIGTFLVFSDYARNAIRMTALMKKRVIYVFTHDSIGLGEDGPTHQPIEHAAMLRMTPNLRVWRPADLMETAIAWQSAIEHHNGPSCLLLSRQTLPVINHSESNIENVKKGGYIVNENITKPDIILIATGSELQIAIESAKIVQEKGINARVVSMPCVEVFLSQDLTYQEQVLPKSIRKRIAIEASAKAYWYQFVGLDGYVLGIDSFGKSAPAKELYNYYGLTVEKTVLTILHAVENHEQELKMGVS
ncbi:MAG: transketolase [Legionellales bacterium RIFCSPHIGHO2_12_FULL_35_11]|nr:MAG: transketolase [Legionellales bacterium RIFCSPHIGHO2_12_FULL_35_11]